MKYTVRGSRRILVDMHIPDWDERFLSKYDPVKMAEHYQAAGLNHVMFYCQSHVGLCNWPTQTGRMHAGLRGRDVVGEMLDELRKRDIDACAYYSVIYNNWAYLEHPEWRIVPSSDISDGSFAGQRYGHCCPNNPDYRDFVMAQVGELVGGYRFDGLYVDMTFWPAICVCEHCRARCQNELAADIPQTIDWFSPHWSEFQTARERWMCEFAGAITQAAKAASPGISVNHNFAASLFNWTLGLSFESNIHHDCLGADFYGDSLEQLVVSKMMTGLAGERPVEFQTSVCVNLRDHVRLKSRDMLQTQAFAAAFFGSSFMFIDAINPDGTANAGTFSKVRDIFDSTMPYEPHLGGEPVEDVGVYFSSDSKMDFAENGLPITDAPMWRNDYPHVAAVRGVCRVLQREHIPFGVITRRQLGELDRYKVIVLPNVLRMSIDEAEAIREYVRRGGRVYASRYTSLVEICGVRHPNFMLSDLFGCDFSSDDLGQINYIRPVDAALAESIAPQSYLSHFPLSGNLGVAKVSHTGMLKLAENTHGKVLATLTLPYASPEAGSFHDQSWSSIHSSPPWEDMNVPVIVEHAFGDGAVIYSAADIECVQSEANDVLFAGLIRRLMAGAPSYSAQTHPCVWMNVFHQPEQTRFKVCLLNNQPQHPVVPVRGTGFSLRPPDSGRYTALKMLPGGEAVPFTLDEGGTLRGHLAELDVFAMLAAQYE